MTYEDMKPGVLYQTKGKEKYYAVDRIGRGYAFKSTLEDAWETAKKLKDLRRPKPEFYPQQDEFLKKHKFPPWWKGEKYSTFEPDNEPDDEDIEEAPLLPSMIKEDGKVNLFRMGLYNGLPS